MNKNEKQDCSLCRITGTLTGVGISSYALYLSDQVKIPPKISLKAYQKAIRHRLLLGIMSGGKYMSRKLCIFLFYILYPI